MEVDKELSLGAMLAAKRKIETKIYPVCLEEFEGIKAAKFCTNKCKKKDKYQRAKQNN